MFETRSSNKIDQIALFAFNLEKVVFKKMSNLFYYLADNLFTTGDIYN